MLTDFHNSFTSRLTSKFATNSYLNIPPYLKRVATLPGEISMFKKSQFLRSNWSKLPCKTSPTQKTVLKYLVKYSLVNSLIKRCSRKMFTLAIQNTIIDCTLLLKQRKTCCNKMPYMTSSQSVTDGISQSVSQNWSIAVGYFVDNKLTLICLLT